jgi:hypothetical protein
VLEKILQHGGGHGPSSPHVVSITGLIGEVTDNLYNSIDMLGGKVDMITVWKPSWS